MMKAVEELKIIIGLDSVIQRKSQLSDWFSKYVVQVSAQTVLSIKDAESARIDLYKHNDEKRFSMLGQQIKNEPAIVETARESDVNHGYERTRSTVYLLRVT